MTTRVQRLLSLSLVLGLTLVGTRTDAQMAVTSVNSVSVAVRVSDYQLAVSDYFKVPAHDVAVIRDRRIRDEDLPVVLFVAQRAELAPSTVVDLRLRGYSWWDISARYHLGPEVYYVPFAGTPGPPYGNAYGYYQRPRSQWNTIVLTDADVVNLVNLRFLTEHYHVSPQRVMELRGRSGDFLAVEREVSGRAGRR
jgi:hypothetical protein